VTKTQYKNLWGTKRYSSPLAVREAMLAAGWDIPTLYVSPEAKSGAIPIAVECGVNLLVDNTLSPDEWYVEFRGNRVGSNP